MYAKKQLLNLHTKGKTLDILVEFLIWCLQHGHLCLIQCLCTFLNIRCSVAGDFMYLLYSTPLYMQ